ncbi:phosphate/phosphite/phosphonate ABC transporter substrate-binding protein [Actinokineospora fastidiosa]|uniref:Selenate ABC transporter substrate-binding protein n=1 Tax=Actinokineospora fastidiosa TaxID=1816 RepID=A0A918GER1_9PSEU|nr:phosphate/phosphite/phosphonate ABC transporter substrate-binding protein [Actinokineospora fastidiosa]GGS28930.1 putative selenate ABC transporter substrate-binding protein [Actinokineospora fastidiosa]
MRKLVHSAVLLMVIATACGTTDDPGAVNSRGLPETLRVGIIPNMAPDKQSARYDPLREYLSTKLDTAVELFVATDYAGVVAALAAEKVDIAYLGGLTYVQAKAQVDVRPLVTEVDKETGAKEYLSGIVVRDDSPYRSVADVVAGKGTFAFGDVSSTSGSLYPRMMLNAAGASCSASAIDKCPPLSEVAFTGGHDATAQAVVNGSADAGGIELRILHRLENDGKLPKGRLRVVGTERVMGYPWVMRSALGEQAATAITAAFLEMNQPGLLDLLQTTGYQQVTDADYASVEKHAVELGLLTA